jgi:hypothetical protein
MGESTPKSAENGANGESSGESEVNTQAEENTDTG